MARTASEWIIEEATSWPGVEARNGRRSELALMLGRRELGHLHGDHAAHFGFPKSVWRELHEQGRIVYHPVFPGREGPAARRIESDSDVRDVIELLRLNYDRVIERYGMPAIPGLFASTPEPLPVAPSLHIRAFLLERDRGNVLVYTTQGLASDSEAIDELGGVARHYLNHHHEAAFASDWVSAPLFVHAAERESVAERMRVRGTFSRRHTLDDDLEVIPTPGHTSDATAFLWRAGDLRVLFSGDTIYLRDGEWVAAMLDSSDRDAYIESLELIAELDFDVLVPWAASAGQPYYALTDRDDTRRRIDAILRQLGEESLAKAKAGGP
jgi:glyoxylase-like metal-dependent hydrolase (beta-lactamase superfamily II)